MSLSTHGELQALIYRTYHCAFLSVFFNTYSDFSSSLPPVMMAWVPGTLRCIDLSTISPASIHLFLVKPLTIESIP